MSEKPPKFLWSADYLSDIVGSIGDRWQIMRLSPIAFRMLSDMSDMVLWPSRYENEVLPDYAFVVHGELNNPVSEEMQDIINRLTELENMNITVNQNCGCGCGDGNKLPPDWLYNQDDLSKYKDRQFNDVETNFPPEYTSREEYDSAKCQLSGKLVDDFITSIENMTTLSGVAGLGGAVLMQALLGTSALSGAIVGLMMLGLSATGAVLLLIGVFVTLALLGTGMFLYFGSLATGLWNNRQSMICQVYNQTTMEGIKQVFIDNTNQVVGTIAFNDATESSAFESAISQIIDLLLPDELMKAVLVGAKELLNLDVMYDCTACAGTSVLYTFDADLEEWDVVIGRVSWNAALQAVQMNPKSGFSPDPTTFRLALADLLTKAGLVSPVKLSGITFDVANDTGNFLAAGKDFDVAFYANDPAERIVIATITDVGSYSLAIPEHVDLVSSGGWCIEFVARSNGSTGNDNIIVDNIGITLV